MSKSENQKFKLYYIIKILLEKTDENHGITITELIKALENKGIHAERKSLYKDFDDITDKLDMEVLKKKEGKFTYYRIEDREFELPEVKLLIDAVQFSKFITEKKSKDLIQKIKKFVSIHDAKNLDREVFVQGRVKTMNESIYYNVDEIHRAILTDKKISFKYYKWDINKKLVEKYEGVNFKVSPLALIWDDENYYLAGFDDYDKIIKHYRVDKMKHISLLPEERDGKNDFNDFNMVSYSTMNFGMFSGKEKRVKIKFNNDIVGVFIDKFGKDIPIVPIDNSSSYTRVDVFISPIFFAWVLALGEKAKLTDPDDVVLEMKEFISKINDIYK